MKRSTLHRKTPLTARQPMRRRSPRKREASPKPRKTDTRFRSPTYLAWIRQQPCAISGRFGCEAHHAIALYNLSGMGLTAPDNFAMPLTPEMHRKMHAEPALQREQPRLLLKTIEKGLREFPSGPIHEALLDARAFVQSKQEVGDD